ncbi:hypothetical protein D6745_01530 [Candidatus Woesearchaeota archaeon]|nr:MAG: hypothetical protein D6745_01530 [Candidatus Woesearchaeota archaeon]
MASAFSTQEVREFLELTDIILGCYEDGRPVSPELLEKTLTRARLKELQRYLENEAYHSMNNLRSVCGNIKTRYMKRKRAQKSTYQNVFDGGTYEVWDFDHVSHGIISSMIFGLKSRGGFWQKYPKHIKEGRRRSDFARATVIVKHPDAPHLPRGVPDVEITALTREEREAYRKNNGAAWEEYEKKWGEKNKRTAEELVMVIEKGIFPFKVINRKDLPVLYNGRRVLMRGQRFSMFGGGPRDFIDADYLRFPTVEEAKEFVDDLRNKNITETLENIVGAREAFSYEKNDEMYYVARDRSSVAVMITPIKHSKRQGKVATLLSKVMTKYTCTTHRWESVRGAEEYMDYIRKTVDARPVKKTKFSHDVLLFKRGNNYHILARRNNEIVEFVGSGRESIFFDAAKRVVDDALNPKNKVKKEYCGAFKGLVKFDLSSMPGLILEEGCVLEDRLSRYDNLEIDTSSGEFMSDNYFREPKGERKYAGSINMTIIFNGQEIELKIMTPELYYKSFCGNPKWVPRESGGYKAGEETFKDFIDVLEVFRRSPEQSLRDIRDDIEINLYLREMREFRELLEYVTSFDEALDVFNEARRIYLRACTDHPPQKTERLGRLLSSFLNPYFSERGLAIIDVADQLQSLEGEIMGKPISVVVNESLHLSRLNEILRILDEKTPLISQTGISHNHRLQAYALLEMARHYEEFYGISFPTSYKEETMMPKINGFLEHFVKVEPSKLLRNLITPESLERLMFGSEEHQMGLNEEGRAFFNSGGYHRITEVPKGLTLTSRLGKYKKSVIEDDFNNVFRPLGFSDDEISFMVSRACDLVKTLKIRRFNELYNGIPLHRTTYIT